MLPSSSGEFVPHLVQSVSTDHSIGPADAPVLMVEYADFDCPDCAGAHPVIREVVSRAGDRLRFVFRHFPVIAVHPNSMAAAEAAEAAAAQGGESKFWEMHDRLYQRGDKLGEHDLTHHALSMGLEVYRFQADLDVQIHASRVTRDLESGKALGVTGTPTIFLNGTRYRGKPDVDRLLAAINGGIDQPSGSNDQS